MFFGHELEPLVHAPRRAQAVSAIRQCTRHERHEHITHMAREPGGVFTAPLPGFEQLATDLSLEKLGAGLADHFSTAQLVQQPAQPEHGAEGVLALCDGFELRKPVQGRVHVEVAVGR